MKSVTVCAWLLLCLPGHGAPFINEVLFNPTGTDSPHEYIELRGAPNSVLASGTYLVGVEGDLNGDPGTVQNLFDLSGVAFGGNGFLVLLQKTNLYLPQAKAAVLVNTDNGSGWGSGSSSSIGHRGEGGQTDLENPSVTFLLIQTSTRPAIGDDIDSNDDGAPDGPSWESWTVLDSVGVLDDSGAGDIAYGLLNFRRNPAATGPSPITVTFTPVYLARAGNSVGTTASDWVAGDNLIGSAPNWSLGSGANTFPPMMAGAPLNHLGDPNFGAAAFPGLVTEAVNGGIAVLEGGSAGAYALALNTSPSGQVEVTITAGRQLEISIDGGASYGPSRAVTFNGTSPRTVLVRALDDDVLDTSPHASLVTHRVTSTSDAANYPVTTLGPVVRVNVSENDSALLSELKVNPPGADHPYEFVELRGTPNALLTNVYFLAIEGDAGNMPGTARLVVDLSSSQFGSSGLLVLAGAGHPYSIPAQTTLRLVPELSMPGGGLANGSISFLLVSSPDPILAGEDLDSGNNGILEGLPDGTTLLDAVGWADGDTNDLVYGGVILTQSSGAPDAATRFPGNDTPLSAAAWFNGNLAGTTGDSVVYGDSNVSTNLPLGSVLTPGRANNAAPLISPIAPLSGVINDPTNPEVTFSVSDTGTPPGAIVVMAVSSNPAVVPDDHLTVTALGAGQFKLRLDPVGVGYADITVQASAGMAIGRRVISYAASAAGSIGSRFHTGITDASAAIAINAELMWVGDDENQIIRMYRRDFSGLPVAQLDLSPFLGLTDFENGKPREVDIEGSTRVGNRIYWIGSHSHANIGELRTNRARIFATDAGGSGLQSTLTYVGRYEHLKKDLLQWDSSNGHGKGANYYGLAASAAEGVLPKASDGSGFNIEGLSMAPGSTNAAYVAFRAPLVPATTRFYTLIVPVLNFASLAISAGPPGSAVFGPPIELDLQGRGIRSLEGDPHGYLIVAGAAGDPPVPHPGDFKLFTWTGQPNDRPEQRAADLSGLRPEAIVEMPPGPRTAQSQIQLLSDNGITVFYDDDVQGKFLPEPNFKKFRSDRITLGAVVEPTPYIISVTRQAGQLLIRWRGLPGERYQLQRKPLLSDANWQAVPGDVTAMGPTASKSVEFGPGAQHYYQVILLP